MNAINNSKPKALRMATINSSALNDSNQEFKLNVFANEEFTFRKNTTKQLSGGRKLWKGFTYSGTGFSDRDKIDNQATFVINNGQVTGSFRHNGELYMIRPMGDGQHAVVKRQSEMSEYEDEASLIPDFSPLVLNNQALVTSALAPTERVTITVEVAYTQQTLNDFPSLSALEDHIAVAVAETNTGYQNSDIYIDLELAGIDKVNYTETGSMATDVNRLVSKTDGHMDEIHAIRDANAADVVVLLVSYGSGRAADIDVLEDEAFAISSHDYAVGNYTFGHEIGHLQGAYHNRETGHINTAYPYAQGYINPQSKWRTVMSYQCSVSCPRINYWSNPDKFYQGDIMGNAQLAHNQRRLNETRERFSNFRGSAVLPGEFTEGTGGDRIIR